MDSRKSFLWAIIASLFLSCSSSIVKKNFTIKAIDTFGRIAEYYSAHIISPSLSGEWVACDDCSRILFHPNGKVEFFDFVLYRDSFARAESSTQKITHPNVSANYVEIADTIHYAKGRWNWGLGELTCRFDNSCSDLQKKALISFSYNRTLLPPFHFRYIYYIIGDPDECMFHKFLKSKNYSGSHQ